MGVTVKGTNNIPKLVEVLKKLDKKSIQVGVFGHDSNVDHENINLVTLARVHEYGMTITPKNGKFLAIPAKPELKGKSPRDFDNLVFLPSHNGTGGVLVRKYVHKGKETKRDELMFILVRKVVIPERSFLRTGYDKNIGKITTKIETLLNDVLAFGINPDVFLDIIGREFASLIQKEMKNLKSPPNAPATVAVKGSSNPLHDTGRLIGAIRHEVK